MKSSLEIPLNWSFHSDEVAYHFDAHVREQLPWYDLATQAVAQFGRHFIPDGGLVYDIGASTGNIGNALRETLTDRHARFIAVEASDEMALKYVGPQELVIADASVFQFQRFDFAVSFLTLMFLPVGHRMKVLRRLVSLTRPGGALVIVDKIQMPAGYLGTAFNRLTWQQKLNAGAAPQAVLRKEMSLAGNQRPLDPRTMPKRARQFFQVGEFVGWIIEAPER